MIAARTSMTPDMHGRRSMSQPAKPATLAEALITIEAQAVQISTLTTENTRLTADNTALVGKVEAFRAEFNDRLKPIEATLNVATEGHIGNADDKFAQPKPPGSRHSKPT